MDPKELSPEEQALEDELIGDDGDQDPETWEEDAILNRWLGDDS